MAKEGPSVKWKYLRGLIVAVNMQCNLPSSLWLFYNIFNEDDITPYGFVLVNFFGNSKKKKKEKGKFWIQVDSSENKVFHMGSGTREQRESGPLASGWCDLRENFTSAVIFLIKSGHENEGLWPRLWWGWLMLSWAESSLCKLWACQLWDLSSLLGRSIKHLHWLGPCFV